MQYLHLEKKTIIIIDLKTQTVNKFCYYIDPRYTGHFTDHKIPHIIFITNYLIFIEISISPTLKLLRSRARRGDHIVFTLVHTTNYAIINNMSIPFRYGVLCWQVSFVNFEKKGQICY